MNLSNDLQLALGMMLVVAALTAAVIRPFGISEALVAVPGVGLALLFGVSSSQGAEHAVRQLWPTVAFLAAILTFGHLCATSGVFTYLAEITAHLSRGAPRRLLALVVALAAVITATLTLDATVVLVTPVVLATATQLSLPRRPHSYACAHLSNTGSLVLPVSNLTNLLAFSASGLSFGRFAAVMLLPWVGSCGLDWLSLRVAFRRDLDTSPAPVPPVGPAPAFALAVLCATVAGFVVTSGVGLAPAWAALAGCVALGLPQLIRRQASPLSLVNASSPGFCLFVLCLGVLVSGLLNLGVRGWLSHLIPSGTGLPSLLGLAVLAAALANLLNNIPTTLALLPLVTGSPLAVLAVLIGVNLGPNATYPGSLATLLWRRNLPAADKPSARQFHVLGLSTTPFIVAAATCLLWVAAGPVGLR